MRVVCGAGFIQEVTQRLMSVPLTNSPSLFAVPHITRQRAVRLTPEKYQRWWYRFWLPAKEYSSWKQLFEENADRLDYLLTPGDYRTLGPLNLDNQPGNTAARPKTIRYYNPGVNDTAHPVKRPPIEGWARVSAIRFDGPSTRNWLVRGLTVSHPTDNSVIRGGAGNITVDFCLIEKGGEYLFRIRGASDCTIQRCVIRDTIQTFNVNGEPDDSTGIQIGRGEDDVLAIKILDNEIYNVGDGVQVTDDRDDPTRPFEVLIQGNDIYLEPSRYIDETNTTWDENAIDLKAGSDTPRSTIIRNNRMWGFRHRAARGALGEIIVVQRFCRNILVEDNIMGDAPRGMKDENWPRHPEFDVDKPRHIVFRNNQFYEIRDYSGLDKGAITKPITSGIKFIGNYFARSDYIADQTPPGYQGTLPRYTGNTRVDVGDVQRHESQNPPVPYDEAMNDIATAPFGYDTYERKRWTGPELAMGAIPATYAP